MLKRFHRNRNRNPRCLPPDKEAVPAPAAVAAVAAVVGVAAAGAIIAGTVAGGTGRLQR